MPHSILVGFLSPTDFSAKMVQAVSEKNIITDKNMHIVDPYKVYAAQYEGHAYNLYAECTDALIKAEVAVIACPKGTLSTILAKISGITRGKIILAMSEGVDCAYVQQIVAKGTSIVCAPPVQQENGEWVATVEFSKGFPPYMKGACEDLIGSVCTIVNA